ncbi:YceI family protein [Pedobacter sp. KR3-3]|uniref:YceI family protein n=1 Tax=Pedobacter albus TaxID=3113905 RepID=A0ABU7I8M6_9SPHI|nr:YceI family protein [Pedobacter sp. KR3-3]MEE1945820.1 YceI family protein [Pedobacter sp. KR3-3]
MFNKPILVFLMGILPFATIAQQTYQLDLKKSTLFWKSPKSMGKQHFGYLSFSAGSLSYASTGDPSTGTFVIDMNSINSTDRETASGRAEVNKLLKGDDFLSVAKYPMTTMMVKQIVRSKQANVYKVSGNLTIRGITHPIEFMAMIKKTGNTVTAKANFNIDRIKWNIHHKPKDWDFFAAVKNQVIADEFPVALNLVFR